MQSTTNSTTSSLQSTDTPDEYGEHQYIKKTDDARINRKMGVGACALHPCLTKQSSTVVEEDDDEAGKDVGEQTLINKLESLQCSIQSQKEAKPHKQQPTLHPPTAGLSRVDTLSDSNLSAPPLLFESRLSQRREELIRAGMKHSEATANAMRSLERGLQQSHSYSGADTPTVGLVQTAVSVREVSKLIGRTVVQMSNVRRIMIVTKPNDTSLVSLTRDLAIWLMTESLEEDCAQQPMVVYIEEFIARHRSFNLPRVHQKYPQSQQNLQYWTPELCARSPEIFDFVVTLGGDGTVLYTSWLFQKTVPPIIPFHLGSLGFLTVFGHRHARRVLDSAIHAGVRINLRMRFTCTVYRLADAVDPQHANVLVDAADCNKLIDHEMAKNGLQSYDDGKGPAGRRTSQRRQSETASSARRAHESITPDILSPISPSQNNGEWDDVPQAYQRRVRRVWKRDSTFQVMNELVVDRGPNPYLSQIELYGDGNHLTTVEADGLCLATPTGSTAYSLAAGGSLVHPEIPAILVTPICPHTLSFRPMLLPDSMVVRVVLPPDSRSTVWASFDGRHRIELNRGDHIQITASKYPLPTVCATQSQTQDWMASLTRCLNWNERKRQKRFSNQSADQDVVTAEDYPSDDGEDEHEENSD